MAEVFLPRQPCMPPPMEQASSTSVASLVSSTVPEPNPQFVFPKHAQLSGTAASAHRSRPSSASGTRRSADRSGPQRLSINALPAFDFNPSGSNDCTSSSPGRPSTRNVSPNLNYPTSGHRRNGSEFIGGDGKRGGLGLMSTTPTEGEGVQPPQAANRIGPPSSKRGHAHRRSGAVSSHDLSHILKPSHEPRGSSLPATPSNPKEESEFSPFLARSASQPEVKSTAQDLPSSTSVGGNGTVGAQSRARVGFSDTVEFIPRPLSTISSETSSSLSTIRASHSVTGSITSIVSTGTSSPPFSRFRRSSTDLLGDQEELRSRPRTAESSPTNVPKSISVLQDNAGLQRPLSASRPNHRSTSSEGSTLLPNYAHCPSLRDIAVDTRTETAKNCLDRPPPAELESPHIKRKPTPPGLARPRFSMEPKVSKRQRKVKSWAGSILSRKTRLPSPVNDILDRTSSASPLRAFAPSADLSVEDVNFDNDTTCVIRDPSHIHTTPRAQVDPTKLGFGDANVYHDESSVTMLDLDAALESDSDDLADGGFFAGRRRMHSSGATGGFSGPGMHYHRRAESAPEMVPIDYHTFGFPRFNSNPKMADVFEEEEEDEDGGVRARDHTSKEVMGRTRPQETAEGNPSIGLGVTVVDAGRMTYGIPQTRILRRIAGSVPGAEGSAVEAGNEQEPVVTPTISETPTRAHAPIEVVEADEEPRASSLMNCCEDSSVTPTLSNNPLFARPPSAPVDFALSKASLPYATPDTLSSAVSSPDFSVTSFDMPRLHTANSSITDRVTLSSCQAGDQGLSLRGSVDDVPSLTSSASTMISAQPPRISSSAYTSSSAERSSSLSAAGPRTRAAPPGKRSSLASLSRLVGSSYGERSKLNIEEHASLDGADKVQKKKGNRISRLMQFWKSKEKFSS